ncbi:MAG TPA: DNA polymerase IV [Streptosporangiaceae bacterium]|nr:DNA polymerase IV [Streptosporangiaceae bacterium]
MPARVIHVDLDAFFVEVCRQRHPHLRDIELLVVGGRRDQRGVVQSASYGARRFGIRSGMPIAQAARLCPQATFFQGSFSHYRDASRSVRAVLGRFSPAVVMASLDEAYLDFAGTERLQPISLLPVAEQIRDAVRQESGLDCSIGIGPNRMMAKLASDYAKPRGLMEVRAGWEAGFLAGLPLRALPGVGPKTAERWAARGLTEVAQVQRLSLAELRGLAGCHAKELKLRAHGHGSAVVRAGGLPKSISRETTLARDSTDREQLEGLLALFAARVGAELRAEGLTARTITLKLRQADFQTVTRSVTLTTPTDLDAELLEPAIRSFRAAFTEAARRRQGVRLIGVAAGNLRRGEPPDLFESEPRSRLRALTRAVDQVRAKFGFDAVTPARLLETRR